MVLYAFQALTLAVQTEAEASTAGLEPLLMDLSFVRTQAAVHAPALRLLIHPCPQAPPVPPGARAIFRADGLAGFAHGEDCYLTDDTSLFHLQPPQGQATAWLVPTFQDQPGLLRQQFWAFGLLKLLRPHGLFALHAAGVITERGQGLLIVGASGSGKSTLTLGVVQHGWRYLSDDAVLLHQQPAGVEALALRRPFALDGRAAAASSKLVCAPAGLPPPVPHKYRVDIEQAYPGQYRSACLPQVVLFARIVPQASSTVRPLERPRSLQQLLAQSGPHLFDRSTMPQHLAVLNRLVHQATPYELLAGRDLYDHPGRLASLVADVEGAG